MTAVGLGIAMREGKRQPKAAVLKAVGATPSNTFTTFAQKFAAATGPLKGRKLMDPVPLKQVKKSLNSTWKLQSKSFYQLLEKLMVLCT